MNMRLQRSTVMAGLAGMAICAAAHAGPEPKAKPGDDAFVGPTPVARETKPETSPETAEAKVQLKSEVKTESKAESKAEPKSEPKAEPKTERAADPNAESKARADSPKVISQANAGDEHTLKEPARTPRSASEPDSRAEPPPKVDPGRERRSEPRLRPAIDEPMDTEAGERSETPLRSAGSTKPSTLKHDRVTDEAPLAPSGAAIRLKAASEAVALGAAKGSDDAARPAGPAAAVGGASAGGLGATRTILALSGVIALILLVAGVFRKMAAKTGGLAGAVGAGGKAPSGILSILGRYPLDRHTTLILLKVDRRVLLLSQSRGSARLGAGTVTTLCEFDEAEDVASIVRKAEAAEGGSLAERFQRALEQADDEETGDETETTPTRGGIAGVLAKALSGRTSSAAPRGPQKRTESVAGGGGGGGNKDQSAALAAALQAALASAKQNKTAARPAPVRLADARTEIKPTHDAAAELRQRLAGMRAKAALEAQAGRKRTEIAA